MKIILLALLLAGGALAQSAAATAPAQSFLATMTDPLMLSMAAYDLSQVAAGSTAWKFTVAGKTYSVSAAQQTGITAASTVAAAAIAHHWPKLRTPLTITLALVSAYYGGVAYAQAQDHGSPATTVVPQLRIKLR